MLTGSPGASLAWPMLRARLERWLTGEWRRFSWLAAVLLPLSLLFGAVTALRRALYRAGVLVQKRLDVPVIVVGNLDVGGSGKTPLVIALVHALTAAGLRPGVISRGHGARARGPRPVMPGDDAALVGDEPLLIASRAGCPVWIGRDRVAAGRALTAAHPEVNVVLADDGLQHYRLARDVEIVVVDGQRGFGNGLLLPAGPLRERPARLASVDAVVVNGAHRSMKLEVPVFAMRLAGDLFYNLARPELTAGPAAFAGKQVHAVAGIGHPERFFAALERLGLSLVPHAFPDHYAYRALDLAFGDGAPVVMTEKDAVKCRRFATPEMWAWPVRAEVDAGLIALVLAKLRNVHGSQTA